MTPTIPNVIDTPRDKRTPDEIANYLKNRFRPHTQQGKKAPEVRWTTTCLTTEPTDESAPKNAEWEGSCILHTSIDVLTHGDGVRHSGFEGHTLETTRGLLVIVACALRLLQKTWMGVSNLDPYTIEDLADAFSFCEIRKKSISTYQILHNTVRLCQ